MSCREDTAGSWDEVERAQEEERGAEPGRAELRDKNGGEKVRATGKVAEGGERGVGEEEGREGAGSKGAGAAEGEASEVR